MWVLETEGDALQGKKLWLPPGKKFIFGRTKTEVGQFVIANKTISRQHLVVEVGTTAPFDCQNVNSRSILTLTDRDTKIGTLVNGEQIRGKSHVVSSGNNVVTLGKYEYHFTFTWVPVSLTFSFTAKEARADPYSALSEQLGPFDIKVLTEYKRGLTTHLVAKKRNTSKGLQALIDGKYIVHNDSYIRALVAACTPLSDGSTTQSPLEEDFDGNFPDPLQYLPPRGEEPTQRDASAYSPSPIRQNMFEGYTFVFYEKRQHENLLAPIFEGGGKALVKEVVPNNTTVDEFVEFVKQTAGEKGLGSFEDGSEGKGVVVVRFNPVKGAGSDWFADFNNQVSLRLDHRLIEQNEFLDAILGNDASVLRRPLEFVQSIVVAPPPSVVTAMSSQAFRSSPPQPQPPAPTLAQMAPTQPLGRVRSRFMPKKFTGFDEDFTGGPMLGSVPESMGVDLTPAFESQSQGLFVSQDSQVDRRNSQPADTLRNVRNGSKRDTPPMDYDDSKDIMDDVAPAAQAFKKRKLAVEAARRQRGESIPPPAVQPKATAKPKTKTGGSRKEIDIQEVLAKKQVEDAERAEELARTEREALEEALEGMPIDDIRNLAIIKDMPVMRKLPPPSLAVYADESDRWDERWNGRKNFKKFRRRGADPNDRRVTGRVIVQLEEVKKKDFGIGDEYWLEGDPDNTQQRKKKKGKGRIIQETQTQPRARPQQHSNASGSGNSAEILVSEEEGGYALPVDEEDTHMAASSDVEVVAAPTRQPAARSHRGSKLADKTNESQNLPTHRASKRAAATMLAKPAPAKKAKPTPVAVKASDDDSEDDGLKFRFARRN